MRKIVTILLLIIGTAANANSYFVSANGNDSSTGRTIATAWKTLSQVNKFEFSAGDSLLLEGGSVFIGAINIIGDAGTHKPITISSFGIGKATLSSGTVTGILFLNAGDITISNIIVIGKGYKATTIKTHGIEFRNTIPLNSHLENITIDKVEVSGYGGNGIYINPEDSSSGFSNITITNCLLHDNGITGLYITGYWDDPKQTILYSNSNVYVGYTIAYNNYGRSDFKANWSGSGLLVAGTVNGLVEHCEAYENGLENGSYSAGPIGIWTDDSKFVTIQHCISHHNKGGKGKKDGGGFDIDGGCFGCVIQYCESYENEGAGYGLYQWKTGNAWSYDTVRYNTSLNDGRNPYYGSITCWGAGAEFKVTEAQVYGNKITMDQPGKALGFLGNNFLNVSIHDNEFCLDKSAIYAPYIPGKVTVTNSVFKCDSDIIVLPPVDTIIVEQHDFFVYPNPVTNNIVNLKFSNMASGEYTIRLINYSGMAVYSNTFLVNQSVFITQINVSKQAIGVYALQLINNKQQFVKTIIVN